MIVAYDNERTIGANGLLPWEGQLPADMQHFKEVTSGTSVIMGRTTFESLPEAHRPLRNRQNIVMTLSGRAIEGAVTATSIGDAFSQADNREVVVIGGAQIYEQALPFVNRLFVTEIDTVVENGDTTFPQINDDEWFIVRRNKHERDEKNAFDHTFITYLRRSLTQSGGHEKR